jgi:hypothetical protein
VITHEPETTRPAISAARPTLPRPSHPTPRP